MVFPHQNGAYLSIVMLNITRGVSIRATESLSFQDLRTSERFQVSFEEFYNWIMEDAQRYLASKLLEKSSAPAGASCSSGWCGTYPLVNSHPWHGKSPLFNRYTYVYIYIYIYTHTYTYIYIYTYVYIDYNRAMLKSYVNLPEGKSFNWNGSWLAGASGPRAA